MIIIIVNYRYLRSSITEINRENLWSLEQILCIMTISCRQWFQEIPEFCIQRTFHYAFAALFLFDLFVSVLMTIIIRNLNCTIAMGREFWIKLPFRLVMMKPLSIWDSLSRRYLRGCNHVISLLSDIWQGLSHRNSLRRYSQDHSVTAITSTF